MSDNEIDEIIENLDLAKNGVINYSEFLSATIDLQQFMTKGKLEQIFKTFDIDDSG